MKTSKNVDKRIYHLVYVSTATTPLELDGILHIENIAKIKNEKADVTGLLTYCDCKFMQFLEGQKSQIEQIFSAIKRDQRHHSIDILRQGEIPKRQFSGWSMKYAPVDIIHGYKGDIHQKLFDEQNNIIFATESIGLLVAFKNSCSNQVLTKYKDSEVH